MAEDKKKIPSYTMSPKAWEQFMSGKRPDREDCFWDGLRADFVEDGAFADAYWNGSINAYRKAQRERGKKGE